MNIPLLITDDNNNAVFAIYEDGTVEFTTAKGIKKKCTTSKDIALALAVALRETLLFNEMHRDGRCLSNIGQDSLDLPTN